MLEVLGPVFDEGERQNAVLSLRKGERQSAVLSLREGGGVSGLQKFEILCRVLQRDCIFNAPLMHKHFFWRGGGVSGLKKFEVRSSRG